MILPANRIAQTGEYYFSHKLKEIKTLQNNGCDIINLGIGNPDLLPSISTLNRLSEEIYKVDSHGYQPYKGIDELRNAFSQWYQRIYNVSLNPDSEVLPLIGSKEGIFHISMAFLNSGDKVLVPDPGYPSYQSVSKLVGAEIIIFELKEENNWAPDLDKLQEENLVGVKLMWINYPNMPSGAIADIETLQKIIEFGKRNEIIICNDNPYSLLLNENPISILSVEGAKDIAIELNSLSKSHNMAGWRLGMLASNPNFIQHILTVKSNVDSGIFRPLQIAAVEALNNSDNWYKKQNNEYRKRKIIACKILDLLNCIYQPNQAGMFVWARIPECYASSAILSDLLLKECKIFISPGFIFGKQGEKYIRISLCNNISKLIEAKNRIEKFIK